MKGSLLCQNSAETSQEKGGSEDGRAAAAFKILSQGLTGEVVDQVENFRTV